VTLRGVKILPSPLKVVSSNVGASGSRADSQGVGGRIRTAEVINDALEGI
jgi:hypothetical protein